MSVLADTVLMNKKKGRMNRTAKPCRVTLTCNSTKEPPIELDRDSDPNTVRIASP